MSWKVAGRLVAWRVTVCGTALAVPLAGLALAGPASAVPTPGSTLSIVAGDGTYSGVIAGPASASPTYYPRLLAADGLGNVFVSFRTGSDNQYQVARIDAAQDIAIVTNSAGASGAPVAGPALSSPFASVSGIAADKAGNLFVADESAHRIVKVTRGGTLSIIAGDGTSGAPVPGPALQSPMDPSYLAVGPDGSLYAADNNHYQVVKITPAGTLSVVTGDGTSDDPTTGGPATSSRVDSVRGLAVDSDGNLFVSNMTSSCVTMVNATTGDLDGVLGQCGSDGSEAEGPALSSGMDYSYGVAVDRFDDLYAMDGNYRVEKVTDPASTSREMSFVVGTGSWSDLVAGPALTSPTKLIDGLAVTPTMDLYLADDDARVWRIAGNATTPTAPRSATAAPGNRKVTLSFRAPTDDGGRIVRYEYSIDGGAHWLPSSGTWETTTSKGRVHGVAAGLVNGRRYTFKIRAVSTVGPGPVVTVSGTPHGGSGWFHDVISRAQRRAEIAVPAHPDTYQGPRRHTKARNRSYQGKLAMPIPSIGNHTLGPRQAAVLSGDGLFDFNKSTLTAQGRAQVRQLARALRNTRSIACEGYTDYAGSTSWENTLSRARAARVCTALVKRGVDASTSVRGYGPQRPTVVGGTARSRKENRRVVVLVRR